ncbi:MAG: hypothetical protein IPL21_12445 [Saprospirales bacterium]|nr:hypothetical protein [Saprospirales bacterium]
MYISLLGFFLTPILYYNHKQEAGFLLFVYILAYSIFIVKSLSITNGLYRYKTKSIILMALVLFFPFGLFNQIGMDNPFFSVNGLVSLKEHISTNSIFWILGNLNGPRVFDTLGLLGFAPFFVFIYFIFRRKKMKRVLDGKENTFLLAMLPGLLPFWIILIPLNVVIWMKGINMSTEVFWRFCYFSQFWISISYIFFRIESKWTSKLLNLSMKGG